MILLYRVVVCPDRYDTRRLHDGMVLDDFRLRWWNTEEEAQGACRGACELIGPRPKTGIQHRRPIPIAVFEVRFANDLAVARGNNVSATEIFRLWQHHDGFVSSTPQEDR